MRVRSASFAASVHHAGSFTETGAARQHYRDLFGYSVDAVEHALHRAPFPCTLTLARLCPVSAAVRANALVALPRPLFRGLRVRAGCFTGAPEVERDVVTKRMDFYGPAVSLANEAHGLLRPRGEFGKPSAWTFTAPR